MLMRDGRPWIPSYNLIPALTVPYPSPRDFPAGQSWHHGFTRTGRARSPRSPDHAPAGPSRPFAGRR